jgi:periplasmic protein TonB
MERQYALPIAFAAAAHAALLFGFSRPPQMAAPIERTRILPFELSPPVEIDPPVPEGSDTKSSAPKNQPEVPRVVQPEPLVVDFPTSFVVPPPPQHPIGPADIKVIPVATGIHSTDGRPGVGDIVGRDFLDKEPRTRFQAAPIYPFEAKKGGVSGEVLVDFVVDESGRVHDPRVVRSSDRVFEESALRAVAKWQFEPGRRDNKIVRFRMSVPIVFTLND